MDRLVKRRKIETRAEIVGAAIECFSAHGFDDVSMDDIAAAAGVSRRTVYRYFETKDDLIFDAPREWVAVLDDAMATRADDESTRDVYRRALLAVSRHIEADADRVLRAFAILQSSPSLSMRHGRSDAEWTLRLVELMAPDVVDDPDGDLRSLAAAMSLVAAGNALIATWAMRGPEADLVAMTRTMLDQLDSVWPPASR